MYEYNICDQADEDIFHRQCTALEKRVPELVQVHHLKDVDSSETKIYTCHGQCIEVHNSYYVDAIYIKSEMELGQYLEKLSYEGGINGLHDK